jgi:hypothetical protein
MAENYIDVRKAHLYLTPDQIQAIEKNPARLTREGCEKEIENWKRSSNRQVLSMYEVMLKKCSCFVNSGKTTKGELIFARDENDKPVWVGHKGDKGLNKPKEAQPSTEEKKE